MSQGKRLRERLAEIERQGLIVEDCKQARGSHFKARVTTPHGPVTIVFGTSASDHRAEKNFAAFLRRLQQQEAHR